MSSWSQYFVGQDKREHVKQVTYLCGTEPILIQWAVNHITALLGPHPWNIVSLSAEQDSEREVWAELERHPIDNSYRLVVLRDFEKLSQKHRLTDWIKNAKRQNPKTHVIVIEKTERIPVEPVPGEDRKTVPVPYIAELSRGGRGHVIECRPFTQATAKHAVAWVRSMQFMSEEVAAHLLNRAAGDLRLVRDSCIKLAVLDDAVSVPVVDEMLRQRPRAEFCDALLQMRKADALLALARVPVSDYSRILGKLDADVEFAGFVHDQVNDHKNAGEMAKAAGKSAFLIPKVLPIAKHYGPARRTKLRKLLAVADETLQGGHSVGVLEAVVTQW